jgi:hypothetical protein
VKPRSRPLAVAIAVLALLAAPSAASAAVVNNGDFETGNFAGWHEDYIGPDVGSWFVYTGTSSPIEEFPIPAPPQGTHAAIADQDEVSRQILYQDLTLPPGGSVYQLSLFAYYTGDGLGGSAGPFISPDTLSLGPDNEQYRIDLMKPSSPVDSVSSGDVLRNLLRTTDTSPDPLVPTMLTADLSPFAGQTVRIRLAVAVTEHTLNAGVDAVSVKSNGFSVGAATRNKKKGTAGPTHAARCGRCDRLGQWRQGESGVCLQVGRGRGGARQCGHQGEGQEEAKAERDRKGEGECIDHLHA